MPTHSSPHIAVIGAGAMGGWAAYHLQQRGARVTLIDAWGPGHSRSSSGGETRVIRSVYGPHRIYVKMVAESFPLWREFQEKRGVSCYERTGALWLFSIDDERYLRSSLPFMKEFDLPIHQLALEEVAQRYPQVGLEGVRSAWWEEEAGFLHARRSCRYVAEAVIDGGGTFRQQKAEPGRIEGDRMKGITLSDGSTLEADAYVFACGPWLPKLFPDLLGPHLQITRQEIFFFAPPPGDDFQIPKLPVWVEFGPIFYYGIPHGSGRGFKVADDIRGHTHFDPEGDDRTPTPERLAQARHFLRRRFPRLAGAPLIESRVCQYTNSPDGHLIVDRHPGAANVWIAGAGTGHGYKLGPAIGRHLAARILDDAPGEAELSIGRLEKTTERLYNQFDVRE